MKYLNAILLLLAWLALPLSGQETLTPAGGYRTSTVFPERSFPAFDLHGDLLYGDDGDTIRCMNLESGLEEKKFGRPEGYPDAYASFIRVAPDGKSLWAGFTVLGNGNDRIYSMDLENGAWMLRATLPGNFDLEWWNGKPLVSGLNSSDWTAPGSIFLADLSGLDQHRKIVEVGGYATGIAVDEQGNLYCGTSLAADPNALYRWDSASVAFHLADSAAVVLVPGDGIKLTDLPAGAGDCESDLAGNLVFTFNDVASEKVVARWNGIPGDGYHFDTLALASGAWDWLGIIKSQGDIRVAEAGNRIITTSPGRSLSEVHPDYRPLLVMPLPVISGLQAERDRSLALGGYFTDPDDPEAFTFEVAANSNPSVAGGVILGDTLVLDFNSPGQTNLLIRASNAGQTVAGKVVVGVQPALSGDYLVAGFEEVSLDTGGIWNGADGSGGFISGPAHFHNEYNQDWFSWSGWACSNMQDQVTPGFMNQYSAITGNGFTMASGEPAPPERDPYAVAYVYGNPLVDFTDSMAHTVAGLFITNSTYAALSMEYGDAYSKRFGGEGGHDPDFFRVDVWGYANGAATGPVAYYLADYRFEDDTRDYLIKTWQWLDLSSLGEVDSLTFDLVSSDTGDWGINTPAFFCVDNLVVVPARVTTAGPSGAGDPDEGLMVYPNPGNGRFRIGKDLRGPLEVKVYAMNGMLLYVNDQLEPGEVVDLGNPAPGSYLVRITTGLEATSTMIQIR